MEHNRNSPSIITVVKHLSFSINNNRGFALLYVMGALLIVTFLGSALMNISHSDVVSASDYSAMTTAAISARSAMQACEAMFVQQSQDVVDKLNAFDADPTDNWLLGSDVSPVELTSQQKFHVKIKGFDKTNYVVQLEGTGLGKGGSAKKILGVYDLGDIAFNSATTFEGTLDKAVYSEGDLQIEAGMNITGDFFLKGDLMITAWSAGSAFDDKFVCIGNATIYCGHTFSDIVYFGGNLTVLQGSISPFVGITMSDKSGIEGVLQYQGAVNNPITMQNDTYLKGTTPNKVITNLNGNTYFHDGSVTHSNIGNGNASFQSPINIMTELGISTPPSPQFNISDIPAGCYYESGNWDYYDGQSLNNIYSAQVDKRWNNYAVIKVNSGIHITVRRGTTTFQNRVIFINDGNISVTGDPADIGWPNCSPASVTVIYNRGILNWGQSVNHDDLFRGYLYNDASSTEFRTGFASGTTLNRMTGAIHDMNTNTVGRGSLHPNDNHNNEHITVDHGLFSELSGIGLAGTGSVVTTPTTLELTGAQITPTRYALYY